MLTEYISHGSCTDRQSNLARHVQQHPNIQNGANWEHVHDIICREVSRGRILARFTESARSSTHVYIVELPGDKGLLVVDNGGTLLSPYLLNGLDAAFDCARGILASGQAWNW